MRYAPTHFMTEDSRGELMARERARADVRAASAVRALAVVVAWGVAMELRPLGGATLELAGDVLLAVGGWWATRPGVRAGDPDFMRRTHWTGVLTLPLLLGSYFVAWDVWRLVRGS